MTSLERLTNIFDKLGIEMVTPLIDSVLPSALGARTGQKLNKITVWEEKLSDLSMPPFGEQAVHDALRAIGSPIDNEEAFKVPTRGCGVLTRAGWFNANPALVFFVLNDTRSTEATIMALAREGWISQKTAPKAALRFKKALAGQGVVFNSAPILSSTPD